MLKFIDDKLNIYFDRTSPEYMNYSIWHEIFSYLDSIEEPLPKEFDYEVMRCRDLKNWIDCAYEEGEISRNNKAKIEGKIEAAKQLKDNAVDIEIIMKATGLTKAEIENL